jgi:nicotinate-nucleotide pyrophosphorylase (carboxylating)
MNHITDIPLVKQIVDLAFAEDIGPGDHTSLSTIPHSHIGKSIIVAKEDGVIAGIELAEYIFHKLDVDLSVIKKVADGDKISKGDIVLEINGNSISMLTAERTALNFMQRMSGIATQTALYAETLKGLHTKVIDTRKTTPGMRILDKWAVRLGGGGNHRMGLYDMILIKDNHIDFAGGISAAIDATHLYQKENKLSLPIEIETRNLNEVNRVIEKGGIQRIMLDNFTPALLREAIILINGKYETEASGGITLSNLRQYAETGVDFISSGALTHSVKCLDLSMKAI